MSIFPLPILSIFTSVPRMIWPFQKEFSSNVKVNPNLLSLEFLEVLPLENRQLAAYLQILLSRTLTDATVELVTTDGFLYPNQTLIDQGILNRKGFPESYDMEALLNFLDHLKNGQDVDIPVYSHEVYDIVPGGETTRQSC